MGGSVSAGADNDELVDNLWEADYIKTPDIERVFRAVDRGHYFTLECKDSAYKDLAWRNGNLHMSAPCIYSEVMENLKLAPGMSFLNLGSGTGYLSTMAGLILGSYGINHGVEIHEDVLNYAKQKLDEFCSMSPALDAYEFCQPKFINGNCLHLGSEARQYDRVYCGAACPENHEHYMKNLIKVGGILVMPINDQLLQIYRISDTNWVTKSVLPVSFASLICSNVPSASEPLKMPDADPLSLQDICRFAVRSILRRKIDLEHPELKEKPWKVVRNPAKKRTLRTFEKIVFGIQSDSEDIEIEDHEETGDLGLLELLLDVHNDRPCFPLPELGNILPGPSRRTRRQNVGESSEARKTDVDEEEEEEEEEEEDDEDEDDGLNEDEPGEEEENGNVETSSETETDVEMSASSAADEDIVLISQRRKVKEAKREKFDSGIVEDMENGRGVSSESENEIESGPSSCRNAKRAGNLFVVEDSNAETAASEDATSGGVDAVGSPGKPAEDSKNYSFYMREKIKMLPLPMTLKYFVNLDREL